MSAQHTPGPWAVQTSAAHGYRILASREAYASGKFGHGDVAVVFFAGNGRSTEQCKADAHLIAATPELLSELQAAHQIILNALTVMSTEQKREWARLNANAGVDGEGDTRYHEREAVIARATGGAS